MRHTTLWTARGAPARLRATLTALVVLIALGALAACGAPPTVSRQSTATATTPRPAPTATPSQPAWTVVTTVPADTSDIVFAPSNPQIVYLCADDGPSATYVQQTPRLHKSTDGGQIWSLLTAAPPLHPVPPAVSGPSQLLARCDVFVDAADANDVFLQQVEIEPVGASFAVLRTLYRSRDGGSSWSQLGTISNSDGFTSLYVMGSRLVGEYKPSVYGASQCGPNVTPNDTPKASSTVVASDDGGATWHDTATSIESQGFSASMLAIAGNTLIVAGSHVPASECTYATRSAIWRSTDGGRTWSMAKSLAAAYLGGLVFSSPGAGTAYYGIIAATPVANISNPVLYATTDEGATWTQLPLAGIEWFSLPNGDILTKAGAGDQILRLRLSDPHPTWAVVAPGADGTWQAVTANGVTTLWNVDFNYGNTSAVEYLTLPA